MLQFTAIMLNGLNYAAWMFFVAVGLTLIYGVMRILNIAHDAFYAIGAYACASALGIYHEPGLPDAFAFVAMGIVALVVGVVVGLAVKRGVLRLVYGKDEVLMVLVTYALFLILEDAVKLIWGVQNYFAYQPYLHFGYVEIGGLPYQVYDLLIVALAIVLGIALWFWLERSRMGRMTTAVVADREISAAMGINVTRIVVTTFAIGTGLFARAADERYDED